MSAAPIATADPPFPWRWLALVLLLTLLVRGTLLYLQRDNLNADVDNYREIANNLLHSGRFALGKEGAEAATNDFHLKLLQIEANLGGEVEVVRDTAYRPPLYPLVLSYVTFGSDEVPDNNIIALHLALGLGTISLVFAMAQRILKCPQLAAVAGLFTACDPILLNQQSLVMTETLATFLAVLAVWQLQRFSIRRDWWNAALSGAAIGLAALCRPTFLPWLLLASLALIAEGLFCRRKWRIIALEATCVAAGAFLMISPWVFRNYQVFGKPIASTTHGGYTFFLGNNNKFYRYLRENRSGIPWDSKKFDSEFNARVWLGNSRVLLVTDPIDELQGSSKGYELAFNDIRAEPGMFVWACVYRIRQLWSPLPYKLSADESRGRMALRYLTAAWYLGVYALAAMGIWRLRWELLRPPWIWGVLLCITFTAVHTFYWSNLRMRAPLMPFVALVAAAGAGALLPQAKSSAISAVAK
jgi:hypothetical protein